nr:immunoglobulin light chain junction region [Macaca mulatta]MOW27350.1 immunoglobulin light chain junction region [Macaca mulatta]MOW27356.1 immunoglobulin light chain junction region [Macaca mulatta]MOW27681.1 immunoglobulin light chain junction region [Macaca mulatta]MOW27928.1 immunoglobulin light chain junction region [Macaca mulatta]
DYYCQSYDSSLSALF